MKQISMEVCGAFIGIALFLSACGHEENTTAQPGVGSDAIDPKKKNLGFMPWSSFDRSRRV